MKKTLLLFCFVALSVFLFAQNPPKRELRAAWLTTFSNIDWPVNGATTAQEQSSYITRMDEYKAMGLNAVFLQIRSQCDAMYPSSIEPWSRDLTGTQGTAPNPYYDPLEFGITEARKKGLEFHAWFNPYRALSSATPANLSALHSSHIINNPSRTSWILDCTTNSNGVIQKILNPGVPQVVDYIISVVMDVVRRYDIDGIHMDDYFYPNPALSTYNDDATFASFSRGITNKNDWRRANVDSLIKRLGDSIRAVKPWVKYGISPSGIWISSSTSGSLVNNLQTLGSTTSSGATQHYKDNFANTRLWIQNNWVDYLLPQVYWHQGQTGSDYSNLIPWWNNNAFNRHMYIGVASYKVGDAAQGSFATDNSQIPKQIRMNRANANISGSVFYNTTTLRNNALGHRDSLQQFFYNKPAFPPTMNWKGSISISAPTSLTATLQSPTVINLSWTRPADGVAELSKIKRFAIYRSTVNPVDITNANNLLAVNWDDTNTFTDNTVVENVLYYYVVTSLDRLYNESAASNTGSTTPLPLKLNNFAASFTTNNSVSLQWNTSNEINVSHFDIERNTKNNGFLFTQKIPAFNGVSNIYSATDKNVFETNLAYRLKMVDKDGSYTYSPVVILNNKNVKNTLTLQPTIVQKNSFLNCTLAATNTQTNYTIIDGFGRILKQGNVTFANGFASIAIPNNASAGLYYLQVNTKNGLEKARFIVQ